MHNENVWFHSFSFSFLHVLDLHLGDTGRQDTFIFTLKENRNPGVFLSFIRMNTVIVIYMKYYLSIRERILRGQ